MKERPILFTAPMVRAILEGRKTQTRRVVKPQPDACGLSKFVNGPWQDSSGTPYRCPYGQPGDRLWVREPGRVVGRDIYTGLLSVRYLADDTMLDMPLPARFNGARWVEERQGIPNGIFREAARIHLEITDVRVERLQDISEDDARAEGATSRPYSHEYNNCQEGWSMDWSDVGTPSQWDSSVALQESHVSLGTARWAFAAYICELHGGKQWNLKPTVWDANPWVWAISFKVVTA